MKSTVLAIACLVSVLGLGCVAEVEDPEDQDEQSEEVGEAEQALAPEPCSAVCGWVFRSCLSQGIPQAECIAKYQACVKCQPY